MQYQKNLIGENTVKMAGAVASRLVALANERDAGDNTMDNMGKVAILPCAGWDAGVGCMCRGRGW